LDYVLTSTAAIRQSVKNKFRVWSSPAANAARNRYFPDQFFNVAHNAKFSIEADDAIFTVGSCFARNVESVLSHRGMNLVLAGHGIEAKHYESYDEATDIGGGVTGGLSRSAFNKYTAHSINHELRRVLKNEKYADEGLVELGNDQWFDPHASGLKHLPKEIALQNRAKIDAAVETIKGANITFITLGLTEGWIDNVTGLAMNRHPGVPALKANSDRFSFVDAGYQAIADQMHDTIGLIRQHANPDMKFIVTVSPVPLGATWRPSDIVVSNTASKSKLRAVAEELFRTYDYVDYFPSYEIAMNSPRATSWKEDQLHVQWPLVNHIMGIFQAAYLPAKAKVESE
jgi:hypothetical protein